MSRAVRVIGLEILLKGGFFLSGLVIYARSKDAFSSFTLLNATFTLAYNVIALGIPFIYAREIHRNTEYSIYQLWPVAGLSLVAFLAGSFVFPAYILYLLAGACMLIVDTVYSRYRISNAATLGVVLSVSGLVVFGGNLVAAILLDEDWRYYGIVGSGAAAILFLAFVRPSWPAWEKLKRAKFRDFIDGLSFGATHALFWVRNGLDKIILFPLVASDEYARYGLLFFFVAAFQTGWTSVLRILQKRIFDLIERRRSEFVAYYLLFVVASGAAGMCFLSFRLDYGYLIALGAATHFGNQVFVNLLNYSYPIFYYSAANALVAFLYVGALKAVGVSIYALAQMFALSNFALALLYIAVVMLASPPSTAGDGP